MKKSCRRDKRHWIESEGAEAQEAANRNHTKSMYRIVRELSNSRSISSISRRPKKTWRSTSKKTSKRLVSAGMEPAGSLVTVMDGGFSSPDAPRGTG